MCRALGASKTIEPVAAPIPRAAKLHQRSPGRRAPIQGRPLRGGRQSRRPCSIVSACVAAFRRSAVEPLPPRQAWAHAQLHDRFPGPCPRCWPSSAGGHPAPSFPAPPSSRLGIAQVLHNIARLVEFSLRIVNLLSLLVNFLRHEFFPSHINGGAARPLTERSDVGDGCDASIQRWLSLDPCFRSRDSNAGRNSMSTERLV